MATFRALGACSLLACVFLTHCGDDHFDKQAEMDAIRKTIGSLPAWADLGAVGDAENEALNQVLKETSKYDTQMIRETILEMAAELEAKTTNTMGEKSRLLIMNRLVFKVPEKIPNDGLYPTRWTGARQDSTGIYVGWPLEEVNGKLRLVNPPPAPPRAYRYGSQPDYRAGAEFDYFAQHFPRRRVGQP